MSESHPFLPNQLVVEPVTGVDGVTRIALPTPFSVGTVNVFLIEDEILTLIDTGPDWPGSLDALSEALRGLGRSLADIELVLLTHQHADHVGLAHDIQAASGAEVAALERVADHVAAYHDSVAAEDDFQIAVMRRYGIAEDKIRDNAAVSREHWQWGRSAEVRRRLRVGDVVDLGHRRLNVVTRPGHSPADTVYLSADERIAFVGDHLLERISSNPLIHRPLSGSLDPADRDSPLQTYVDSLRATLADDLQLAFGGHGGVITEPRPLIEKWLSHHAERADHIHRLIADGHRRPQELMDEMWPRIDASQTFLALSELLGHTDLLIRQGRLAEVDDDGIAFVVRADQPAGAGPPA